MIQTGSCSRNHAQAGRPEHVTSDGSHDAITTWTAEIPTRHSRFLDGNEKPVLIALVIIKIGGKCETEKTIDSQMNSLQIFDSTKWNGHLICD